MLTASDLLALPVQELSPGLLLVVGTAIDQGRALAVTLVLSVLVALCAFRCSRVRGADLLLVLAVVALVPSTLTGHAASSANHKLAVGSLMVHVVSATVWVGGLLALVAVGRAAGPEMVRATAHFSFLALCCFFAAGASGVLNAYLTSAVAVERSRPWAPAGTAGWCWRSWRP